MQLDVNALWPRDDSWLVDMLLGMPLGTPEAECLIRAFPEYFTSREMAQIVPHSMLCRRYIVRQAYGDAQPTAATVAGFGLAVEVLPGSTVRRYATNVVRLPAKYHGFATADPVVVHLHVVPHSHQKGGYLVVCEEADQNGSDTQISLLSLRRVQCGR